MDKAYAFQKNKELTIAKEEIAQLTPEEIRIFFIKI